MIQIIIGNIIAFIAAILMAYSGIIKQKKKILYLQTVEIILYTISDLVLGGITGAIINAVSAFRNILFYKNKLELKEKVIITVISIIFSFRFNNLGLIGIFPLLSSLLYLWLMNIENIIKFKYLLIVTTILWFIYDIYIKSYSSAIFDFINILANIISIIQINNVKKKKNQVI